ncbi:MAG: hypothetical protein HUJ76_04420 [Parasporobacterium sp.]|nr:hypothetical protein [Parasporobacterium sp.]
MGSGNKGLYSGAYTGSAPGSVYYMKSTDDFRRFIQNRPDKDVNGFVDVIAHGTTSSIEIQSGGKAITINHRDAARLFRNNPEMKGKSVRLLSCDTGASSQSFAQNLANKLNVVVEAPTKLVWANPNGSYFVASGKIVNGRLRPNMNDRGQFRKYYPGGKKK